MDFEYKKIREIQTELVRINNVFRDLGYTWTLEKHDTFTESDTVDPPKKTFDEDDKQDVMEGLNLKGGRHQYQKKYTMTKQKKEDKSGSEESETESEIEEENEVHERREIVEMIYLLVEKNF